MAFSKQHFKFIMKNISFITCKHFFISIGVEYINNYTDFYDIEECVYCKKRRKKLSNGKIVEY